MGYRHRYKSVITPLLYLSEPTAFVNHSWHCHIPSTKHPLHQWPEENRSLHHPIEGYDALINDSRGRTSSYRWAFDQLIKAWVESINCRDSYRHSSKCRPLYILVLVEGEHDAWLFPLRNVPGWGCMPHNMDSVSLALLQMFPSQSHRRLIWKGGSSGKNTRKH